MKLLLKFETHKQWKRFEKIVAENKQLEKELAELEKRKEKIRQEKRKKKIEERRRRTANDV